MLDWTRYFGFPSMYSMFRCTQKSEGCSSEGTGGCMWGKGGVRLWSCLSGFGAHILPPSVSKIVVHSPPPHRPPTLRDGPWEWAVWGNPINWGGGGAHWPDRGQEGIGLCSASVNGSKEALHQGVCHRLPGTTPSVSHCWLSRLGSSLMNSLIDLLLLSPRGRDQGSQVTFALLIVMDCSFRSLALNI